MAFCIAVPFVRCRYIPRTINFSFFCLWEADSPYWTKRLFWLTDLDLFGRFGPEFLFFRQVNVQNAKFIPGFDLISIYELLG